MWNRIGLAFGLGAAAAGGFLWITNGAHSQPVAPPVIIVQTPPPPPPAAYVRSMPPLVSEQKAQAPKLAQVQTGWQRVAAPAAPPKPAPPATFVAETTAPAIAPQPEEKSVSISSMAALPPPNLPSPSVVEMQRPIPPGQEAPAVEERTVQVEASRGPRSVTLPAGTMITVRLRDTIHTGKDSKDDAVTVTLDAPLIVNGLAIAERGSLQKGRIVDLDRATRMGGRARIAVELMQLTLSDGQTIDINTDTFVHEGERAEKKDTLRRTATVAMIGAAIGAMAAGGKGAAIGAGAGAATGAGSVIFTKSPEAVLPSETRLTFRIKQPVTVTEKTK